MNVSEVMGGGSGLRPAGLFEGVGIDPAVVPAVVEGAVVSGTADAVRLLSSACSSRSISKSPSKDGSATNT